jgi:hypothetical protein
VILISLSILFATAGATLTTLIFIQRAHTLWLQERLIREKQLAIYEEISTLISAVKGTLEYSSGDETLGEWRSALMEPVHEILQKSYQWSIFLPAEMRDLPAQYAGKLALGLNKLNNLTPDQISSFASLIQEIKQLENEAAEDLQQRIREVAGVNQLERRVITLRRPPTNVR